MARVLLMLAALLASACSSCATPGDTGSPMKIAPIVISPEAKNPRTYREGVQAKKPGPLPVQKLTLPKGLKTRHYVEPHRKK